MDLAGFPTDSPVDDLTEVVVLQGENEGKIMPYGLAGGSPCAKLNEQVETGDWIIPLLLHQSQISVRQVQGMSGGLPVTQVHSQVEQWIKLDRDVSGNEGFQEWRLKLREAVLLQGFEEHSSRRMWGHHFRKVLEGAGIEPMPVRTIVHCRYWLRFGVSSSGGILSEDALKLLARSGHSLINARVKVSSTVRLMNPEPECRCAYWKSIGLEVNSGSEQHTDLNSSGGRALHRALLPRLPRRADVIDLQVESVRCAYCR